MEGIVALCMLTGICVVLPILVVWLNLRSKNLAIDKKAAVLMKAIENGMEVDPNLLLEEAKSPKRKQDQASGQIAAWSYSFRCRYFRPGGLSL